MPPATDQPRPRPWLAALRSKVARRVILLFFLCAVGPMALVGVVSYAYVGRQLTRDAEQRVERGAKVSGQAVIERLSVAAADLRSTARRLADSGGAAAVESLEVTGMNALRWDAPAGAGAAVGSAFTPPDLAPELRAHLRGGGSGLVVSQPASGEPSALMARAVGAGASGSILWGRLDRDYLAPIDAAICLFDRQVPIACDLPGAEALHAALIGTVAGPGGGGDAALRVMRWRDPNGAEYVVGYWELFLRPSFLAGPWYVAVAESRATVLQPLARFNQTFPFILLLALWIVLLFSNVQIRRSLEPLSRLTAGTRRVARRDFTQPVSIRSGDEFEELATSFNAMAQRLDRQFRALEARSEIDRAVLATLDVERIGSTVVDEAPRAVGSDGVGIALAPADGPGSWRVMARAGLTSPAVTLVSPDPGDVLDLEGNPEPRWIADGPLPSYALEPLTSGLGLLVVPLILDRRAAGALLLGFRNRSPTDDERVAARQMADQVTVALANARLLARLDRMNWGTVEALGKAIDAKSPWTAGHSGRVRDLALAVGRQLGLDRAALDDLHRGALLHDIGKIGIPNEVLDKPGPLTPTEHDLMRRHVLIGVEILAPIPAYAGALPIVLHHHERWDGTGYPDGLRGNDIPLLARVLSVPDVFDALTSDRPYRPGLSPEEAVQHIRAHASRHFDPAVTRAFLIELAGLDPGPGASVARE